MIRELGARRQPFTRIRLTRSTFKFNVHAQRTALTKNE